MNSTVIKFVAVGVVLAALIVVGAIYSSGMTGSAKALGGGGDGVALCQVRSYTISTSGPITSVTPTVRCNVSGTYTVSATVTSGPSSGLGSASQALAANTNTAVAITIGPSVPITGSAYNVVFSIRDT